MSRLGKLPIELPAGITVSQEGNLLTVKGPKGELKQEISPIVKVKIDSDKIALSVESTDKKSKSMWGLFWALTRNMVIGVSVGFEKKLEINGVGFRASVSGQSLKLNLGFSHPVDFNVPEGVKAEVEGNVITLTSIDKKLLGDTAYKIRKFRKPEPYKGKGIKYVGEVIRKKAGKTAAKEGK